MDNNDLISREEATSTIKSMLYQTALNNVESDEKAAQLYEDIADSRIETWLGLVDSVDAAPVVHGRWVKMTGMMPPEYHGHYECSECGWHIKGLRNSWTREEELLYCPNCGSRNRENN